MKVYKMLTDECSTATKHMIPTKKLIRVARKWQKIVAIGRRIISSVRIDKKNLAAANCSNESSTVDKRLLCYLHIGRETFCDRSPWRFSELSETKMVESQGIFHIRKLDHLAIQKGQCPLYIQTPCDVPIEKTNRTINAKSTSLFSPTITWLCIPHIFIQNYKEEIVPMDVSACTCMLHFNKSRVFPTTKQSKMISAKKLIKLAKRWQKMASIGRKRITLPRTTADAETNSCSTSSVVDKGHFVVYSVDQKRFVLPLEYLKNNIVMELFNLAEEEFGLPGNGILLMPCDANFMEYVVALIKKKPSKEVEKALILSVSTSRCCSSYLYQQEMNPQLSIWSF
ncbi:hypothetical protein V6N11_080682 [Hibiscus sabdariffa]|uniref:Uncharacterized protein n=1 Tax=Hibiscus sabdariffa TaxID=183260 RepID=A0ABR2QHN9_9ROSI